MYASSLPEFMQHVLIRPTRLGILVKSSHFRPTGWVASSEEHIEKVFRWNIWLNVSIIWALPGRIPPLISTLVILPPFAGVAQNGVRVANGCRKNEKWTDETTSEHHNKDLNNITYQLNKSTQRACAWAKACQSVFCLGLLPKMLLKYNKYIN